MKIGNRNVAVQIAPLDGLMGMFDPREQTITIADNLTSRIDIVETFWHELVHAIFDYTRFSTQMQMEMDDGDSPEFDAYRFEENVTESFSKVLLQVMQDNELAHLQG